MNAQINIKQKFGMVIDVDKCTGCGDCAVACAVENNIPPAVHATNKRNGITWMNITRVENQQSYPDCDSVSIPMLCQQCESETPCMTVCPQNAVDVDPATGIVGQVPQRCLGCRYCMTACPYHARYFNWRDPQWPEGMKQMFNPDVAPRMRGVVEKCNFCHGRLHRAQEKAAATDASAVEYVPACAEACPHQAIIFGDLNDDQSAVAIASRQVQTFRFLSRLGTEPKVYYRSERPWVRSMAERSLTRSPMEGYHG